MHIYPDCGIDYKGIFIQLQKDCLFWGEAFYIARKTCAPMIGRYNVYNKYFLIDPSKLG